MLYRSSEEILIKHLTMIIKYYNIITHMPINGHLSNCPQQRDE
jgi:hypothetical protein